MIHLGLMLTNLENETCLFFIIIIIIIIEHKCEF